METKELVTRFKEVRMRVSDPKQMVGKMLCENVQRKWTEDFVDEETGEIVQIERNELVMMRGRVLTQDDVAEINFHLQSGEVKDVLVSNQMRTGLYEPGDTPHHYEVVVRCNSVKHNILLYATCLPMAIQIAIDFCEQILAGFIVMQSAKVSEYYHIVSYTPKKEDEVLRYFVVTVSHWDDKAEKNLDDLFLTQAKDADMAIDIIRAFIDKDEYRKKFYGDYYVKKASESPVTDIVPAEFSSEYIKYAKTEGLVLNGERIGQKPA